MANQYYSMAANSNSQSSYIKIAKLANRFEFSRIKKVAAETLGDKWKRDVDAERRSGTLTPARKKYWLDLRMAQLNPQRDTLDKKNPNLYDWLVNEAKQFVNAQGKSEGEAAPVAVPAAPAAVPAAPTDGDGVESNDEEPESDSQSLTALIPQNDDLSTASQMASNSQEDADIDVTPFTPAASDVSQLSEWVSAGDYQ